MVQIFTIITILMGVSMFFISRDKKIALMFIGCMTLSLLYMDIPIFHEANYWLAFCFILSEFSSLKRHFHNCSLFPISIFLLFYVISFILAVIFSPHLHSINSIYHTFVHDAFVKYFAIIYACVSLKNEKNLKTFIRYSIVPLFILTIMGVTNLIERHSSFVTAMMSNWPGTNEINLLAGEKFSDATRFRVQSMFFNPFNYGYICILCLIMYIYGYSKAFFNRTTFILLIICCSFGIIFCGARTVMIAALVAIGVYIMSAYKLKNSFIIALCIMFLTITAYITIPIVNERINQITAIFYEGKGQQVEGSSVKMRSVQFAATVEYIRNNAAFGRGVNFFVKDLGYGESKQGSIDWRLYGLEGVYLIYLLERGVVGYIIYLLMWVTLLIYFNKSKTNDRSFKAFGISVITLYLFFAHLTGELSSVYPTLLVVGGIIGVGFSNKRKRVVTNFYPSKYMQQGAALLQ